ncbi:glycosyltransferase family protein [Vallitalea guaymasensis]|uniref:Glycosyltransferase n=1 Tax=Vallitalea guaymasensis TaxID=1185412 RepID=A0A8J8MCD2_9FIRM|nr:glycosyltransferase [Vallitalea guaymasensis]QUH30229.1 hypothetical protein HYG85_15475 [Vallitalea guaymasensis]
MKLLFVYSNKDDPCTRKYCFELSKGLKKYVESTLVLYYKELNEEVVLNNDIIIFQRLGANGVIISREDKRNIFMLINKYYNTKKFVYMIDDLVIEDQYGLPKKFIKRCHALICQNKLMKQQIKKYNKNIYILRTYVDMKEIKNVKKENLDKFYVSWVSTGAIGRKLIFNIINTFSKENSNIRFVTMSGSSFLSGVENVISYRYVPFKNMISFLKGTHILLNPVPTNDNYYKEKIEKRSKKTIEECLNCKTEIKYALAGATQNAIISSKTAPFLYSIKNKQNGLLVNDTVEEWVTAINRLYKDDDLREKIIENAYKDVMEHYTLDYASLKALEIFNRILMNNSN